MRLLFAFFFLFCSTHIQAKVRLLTFHYNLPELIEIQHNTLQKFSKDDYELIVINDGDNLETSNKIEENCQKYGIRCVRYEPDWHQNNPLNDLFNRWAQDSSLYSHIGLLNPLHPSVRHSHLVQFAVENFGFNHNDVVGLIDGDCFPNNPLSFRDILGDNDIVGIGKSEGGIEYLWTVFILFHPCKTAYIDDLKFHLSVINGEIHDTSSADYHYIHNHPDVRYIAFPGYQSSGFYHWSDDDLARYGFKNFEIQLLRDLDSLKGYPWPITVEFHVDKKLMHLGNSALCLPGYRAKMDCVRKYLISRGIKL